MKTKGRSRSKSEHEKRSGKCGKCETAAKGVPPAGFDMKAPVDFVEARKNIATLVRTSVNEIVVGFIELAKNGEVGPAKYLFEICGLYPATAETSAKPENSLAYSLLKRLGLPTDPVVCDDDALPIGLPGGAVAMRGAEDNSARPAAESYPGQN